MEIAEVEDMLGSLKLLGLLAPQHVFITDEQIAMKGKDGGRVLFRGLSPKNKRGTIVLSQMANVTTVPHEIMHSGLGFGELAAYPLGSLLAWKYQLSQKFPILQQLKRKVRYQEQEVEEKYKGRIRHFTRQ